MWELLWSRSIHAQPERVCSGQIDTNVGNVNFPLGSAELNVSTGLPLI
jgi:hypothetical protein